MNLDEETLAPEKLAQEPGSRRKCGHTKGFGYVLIFEFEEYMPWVGRNSSPSIVDRAFKYLATVCDNILNEMHMEPYTLCLGANNASRTKSPCHRLKKWLLKKLLSRACISNHRKQSFFFK